MSREDFIEKVTFEYRPEGSRSVARDICCQNILGGGAGSICKGPEAKVCLRCLRKNEVVQYVQSRVRDEFM